jgi:hypothetical protein
VTDFPAFFFRPLLSGTLRADVSGFATVMRTWGEWAYTTSPHELPTSGKSCEGVSMKGHDSTTFGPTPRIHSSMEDFCERLVFYNNGNKLNA